jgi:O-antigen ligase
VGVHVAPADLRALRPIRLGTVPGGDLTWIAAIGVSIAAMAAGVALRDTPLFLTAAAGAVFGLIFAIRPMLGVALIIIARPSLDVWADRHITSAGSVDLNPASIMALMFIPVGAAYIVERWSDARSAPSARPYLLFALIALAGVAVAPSTGGAITEVLRLTSVFVLYMTAYTVIRDRQGVAKMVAAVIFSAALPTVIALWQFAHGGSTVIGEIGRATGTFLHPDPFGIFLGFMAAFLVPLVLCRELQARWAVVIASPLVLIALVGSYTRNGWLGFVVGLTVVAAVRYRSLLVAGPLLLIVIAVAFPSTVHRFSDLGAGRTQYGPGNSLRARFDLWRENLPKVAHNPVLGNGFKAIVETGPKRANVHSDVVRAVVETGVPGLALFIWLLASMWLGCRRAFRRAVRVRDPVVAAVGLGGLAAATGYIVMSLDSNLMTQVAVAGTFWSLAAIVHAAGRVDLA